MVVFTIVDAKAGASSQIRFTHHDQNLGLSSDNVVDIIQDKSGWIWMATRDGLNQFDAYETRIHRHDKNSNNSLSGNALSCLALGDDGSIWVGTANSGLNRFDPETGTAERILPGQFIAGKIDARNLPSGIITDLAISQKHYLWIGTDRGLAVMNLLTGKIRQVKDSLGSNRISCISVFDDKNVYIGTARGEVFRWDANESDFRRVWKNSSPVTAINRDTRLHVWIGTHGSGLFRMVEEGFAETINLGVRDVNVILSDKRGELWVGTPKGLVRLNRDTRDFSLHQHSRGEPASLCHNNVSAVFEDRRRNMLWIATDGGGTSRFHLDQFTFPHFKDGHHGISLPHASIWSIAPANEPNRIWLGTEQGIALWDVVESRVDRSPPWIDQLNSPYAVSILEDKNGHLWVGTKGNGLYQRTPEGGVFHYLHEENRKGSLGHNYISQLFEDSVGRLWVGTYGGGAFLFRKKDAWFEPQESEHISSTFRFVNGIREDDTGRIWLGSQEGLFVLKEGSPSWQKYVISTPGKKEFSPQVTAILPGGDYLWVGTEREGLRRIHLKSGETSVYQSSGTELADDRIVSLVMDDLGFLWICHGKGISRMDTAQGSFRTFTKEDGLQDEGFHPNATASCHENLLFFGGNDGFHRIDPGSLPAVIRPPRPMLRNFEYFTRLVVPGKGKILEKPLSATSQIKIPFDSRNQFAFRFANLDYRFPNRGHFRYKLEGYDKHWINADKYRRAAYQSVPVGTYTFLVQSSQDGKKWPPVFARVTVKITPAWWQTWWFRASAFLLVAGTLFFATKMVIRSRLSAVERREAQIRAERDKAEAALARQLQHAVILERTSHGLNRSGREDEIFANPLKNLADHLKVDHALIYRIANSSDNEAGDDAENEDSEEANEGLKLIANHSALGKPPLPPLPISIQDDVIQQAMNSESSFAVSTPPMVHSFLLTTAEKPNVNSVLFVGTRFVNKSNGVILLFSDRMPQEWEDEEIKLVNALSLQFGISIAQMKLAEKEQQYLKHLEDSMHQAEVANRAKSDFLAKMTHELRTPLNSIIGFTDIVREDESLSPRQRQLINIVNNSGDHLLDVVNDILDLSKIEAGKIERNDEVFQLMPLLKSVHEMLGMKAKAKKIGFDFSSRSSLPETIRCDRSKIRQILINLLGNAIKFTDQGAVTMAIGATAVSPPEKDEDGTMKRTIRLSFEVADTGKGISEEEVETLFEKYSQTESGRRSTEGTGLGLPIARSFIQLLGGDIHVESEIGVGTTFRFYLECDEVTGVKGANGTMLLTDDKIQKIKGYTSPGSNSDVRILIAEDQPHNLLLLRRLLDRAGFQVREANNGQEAVEICEEWRPDMILMDEEMPIMRGSEATKLIREKSHEHDPVIISLTAYALEQAKASALAAGCQDFLAKPFKAKEIYTMISRHLGIEYTFDDAA